MPRDITGKPLRLGDFVRHRGQLGIVIGFRSKPWSDDIAQVVLRIGTAEVTADEMVVDLVEPDEQFIVAEVSKNWLDGRETTPSGPLSRQLEQLIGVHRQRGYRLHSFALHQLLTGPHAMCETIIAVFERQEGTNG